MGVRLYDPRVGRFLEVDPIEGGSANNYDYVAGDPINNLDLAGTFCIGHHCVHSPYHHKFTLRGILRGAALGLGGASLAILLVATAPAWITAAAALGAASAGASAFALGYSLHTHKFGPECFGDAVNALTGLGGAAVPSKVALRLQRLIGLVSYFLSSQLTNSQRAR
jgi:hypothetical protein